MRIDGRIIRLLRLSEDLTQEQLAERLGISAVTTISNAETGYRKVSDSLKVKIIKTFNLTEEKIEELKRYEKVVYA
ncbi:helix-turn-helix domain-containing protein [Bacillus cytotoxicus]|uniref:Helix-turn-helix domain-containing protein n=1 Tax=Bacillus cytotoxicus TaxID=580165 RepID=A0ACC6A7T6_9BACI|nr:helix-turn-helix domain-containing protein [Bacillus cytotoxicus]